MRCAFALGVTAAFLSPFIDAASIHKSDDNPPRVFGLPIQREHAADPLERDRSRMRKRDTLDVILDNEKSLYFANLTLGTPPQSFRVHIDTGSSDMWVNAVTSIICTDKETTLGQCDESGTYSANSSSTYKYVGSNFNISYVDGSGASGDYATDTMMIAGATIQDFQFGIGYHSTSPEAVLGIGYVDNESQVSRYKLKPYNNFPAALAAQGTIASNAYSLWLNNLDSHVGSILFGGVDTKRFKGALEILPVQKQNGGYTDFLITLTSLSLGGNSIANNQAQAVLLDSGSSLTYLPNIMASAIYVALNAQYDNEQGAAFVPCSLKSNNSTLDFTFTSPTISVPMSELVLRIPSSGGQPATFPGGVPACLFGIAPAGVSTPVLGDTFLRSAYVVYDLENNQISLAQTNFNATGSKIVEIGTGVDALGIATAVANPVAATAGVGTGSQGDGDEGAAVKSMGISTLAVMVCGLSTLCAMRF